MAAFSQDDEFGNRLDWKILRDGGVALYWRREFLDQDIEKLRQERYQIFSFDASRWTSDKEMHGEFAQVLSFPAFYGKNLHALNDSLDDLAVPEVGGVALALIRFDAYAAGPGSDCVAAGGRSRAEILIDIFAGASRYFMLTGRRFLTLVQTDDPETCLGKLGGTSAVWNSKEWLNKNRGL